MMALIKKTIAIAIGCWLAFIPIGMVLAIIGGVFAFQSFHDWGVTMMLLVALPIAAMVVALMFLLFNPYADIFWVFLSQIVKRKSPIDATATKEKNLEAR